MIDPLTAAMAPKIREVLILAGQYGGAAITTERRRDGILVTMRMHRNLTQLERDSIGAAVGDAKGLVVTILEPFLPAEVNLEDYRPRGQFNPSLN